MFKSVCKTLNARKTLKKNFQQAQKNMAFNGIQSSLSTNLFINVNLGWFESKVTATVAIKKHTMVGYKYFKGRGRGGKRTFGRTKIY